MKNFQKIFLTFSISILFFSCFLQTAKAIPAFAKKHDLKCGACHRAFPKLNAGGREYKMNGYRLAEELSGEVQRNQQIADDLVVDRQFPISALVKGYLYDQKKDNDAKTRPFHEVEIMLAGNVFKNISLWVEVEAEDENDFAPGVEMGIIGFHISPYANFMTGYGPYFFADPYDTLVDWGRRMTRSHRAPWDVTNSYGSGVRLRSATQFVSFYGKASSLFYSIGYHRDTGDPEGEGGSDISARAAIEFTPEFGDIATNISIGGFGVFGKQDIDGDVDFTRVGVDLQAEIGDSFNLLFAYLASKDDLGVDSEEKNNSFYTELFWVFYNKLNSPSFVPLVRIEKYEKSNGDISFTDLSLNLSYYVTQNVRFSLEYWTNLKTPVGVGKNNRITGYFIVIF